MSGVSIRNKRKGSGFVGGELAPGEIGINTSAKRLEFSSDGSDVNLLGSASVAVAEVDFGSQAVNEKIFTVTDPTVTVNSNILLLQSGNAATGRQADENEFDVISFRAAAGAGQFTVYAKCLTGLVQGKYRMVYQVG